MKSRKIVVTRAAHQAEGLVRVLADRGAVPVLYPCIAIEPVKESSQLDSGLRRAVRGDFDWIIFTSANTVWAVRRRMDALGIEKLAAAKTAAVGRVTAQAVERELGLEVRLIPGDYDAESVARAVLPVAGARIFLPQSRIARLVLSERLAEAGAEVLAVVAYDTVLGTGGADVPAMLARKEIDAVTLTSSSTARNFMTRLRNEGGDAGDLERVCIACMGRETARTAREHGLSVSVLPRRNTLEDLVSGLEGHFAGKSHRRPDS